MMTPWDAAVDYSHGMTGLPAFITKYRPRICPFDRLAKFVPYGSRVLDIGCGNGLWLFILWRCGKLAEGHGVDLDCRAVEVGQAALRQVDPSIPIHLARATGPDQWPKSNYDVVSMIDVLHHVPSTHVYATLSGIMDRVRPGGLFVYKDMASRPHWGAAWNRCHDLLMARQWINYVDPEAVWAFAQSNGFKLVAREDVRLMAYHHQMLVLQRYADEQQ